MPTKHQQRDSDPANAPESLWDANDVAQHLKCTRKTVYNMAEGGRLPCVRIGGLLRFLPERIRAVTRGEIPAPTQATCSKPGAAQLAGRKPALAEDKAAR